MRLLFFALIALILTPSYVVAEDIFQSPESFIEEAFEGKTPEVDTLWFTDDLRPHINEIMGHAYPLIRVKYWKKNKRTVWILEEIGKVKPITTGIIINNGAVEFLKVLIYRESHGWEVKHPFFTDQFKKVALEDNYKLSHSIDNISGATMSVNALRNLTKLALFLHEQVVNGTP